MQSAMIPSDVDSRALDLLGKPIVGHFSFVGRDHYPHVLPVWFDYSDGEVVITSGANAYKIRCIGEDPRVSLAVSTTDWPYWLVTLQGEAVVETVTQDRWAEVLGAQALRYLGEEVGQRYIRKFRNGRSPGEGALIRVRARQVRIYDVSGGMDLTTDD
jgi:hypothetical protein